LIRSSAEFAAIKAGFKRLVFLGDVMPDLPLTGIIAASRYIKENPRIVEKMVRATVRAVDIARENPENVVAVMRKDLKMTPDEARETYELTRRSFSPIFTEASINKVAEVVPNQPGPSRRKRPENTPIFHF
jgi:ABC-type nitrate/sulfonate/bicarbonate transport system substrate-binding protein